MDIAQANDEFGIEGALQIHTGKGDFSYIRIDNEHARCDISTHAGQVLSFQPEGEAQDLLFVSELAHYQRGKAIKGGIPICWPWFGPDPESKGRPDHGFVRARPWQLVGTEAMVDGATRVRLGIKDDEAMRALWPHPFHLEIEITVGKTLGIALITHNIGDQPVAITQALHTYFKVGDVRRVQVLGLDDHDYIDKVGEGGDKTQSGPINFDGPVNRIYLDTADRLSIDDPSLDRRILIDREGSNSCVVWNPWIEQSADMKDFRDDEYINMVCVETTNADKDAVTVQPGETYRMGTTYRIARD